MIYEFHEKRFAYLFQKLYTNFTWKHSVYNAWKLSDVCPKFYAKLWYNFNHGKKGFPKIMFA